MEFNITTVTAWKSNGDQSNQDNNLTGITSHVLNKPPQDVTNADIDKVMRDNDQYGEDYKKQYGQYPPGWQRLDRNDDGNITQSERNLVYDGKDGNGKTYVVYTGKFDANDASQPKPSDDPGAAPPGAGDGNNGAPQVKDPDKVKAVTSGDANQTTDLNTFLGGVDGFNGMDKDTQNKVIDSWKTAYDAGGKKNDSAQVKSLKTLVNSDGFHRLDAGQKQAALGAASAANGPGADRVNKLINDLGFQGLVPPLVSPDVKKNLLTKYGADPDLAAQVDKMMADGRYKNADVGAQTNALRHLETYVDRGAGYKDLKDDHAAKQKALENLWSGKLFNTEFLKLPWDKQIAEVGQYEAKGEFKSWTPQGPVEVNADVKKPGYVKDGPATQAYTNATGGDPTQGRVLNSYLDSLGADFQGMDPATQAAVINAYNNGVEGQNDGAALKALITTNNNFKGLDPAGKQHMLELASAQGAKGVDWALTNVTDFAKRDPGVQASIIAGYNKVPEDQKNAYKDFVNNDQFKNLDPKVQQSVLNGIAQNGLSAEVTKLVTSEGFHKLTPVEQQHFMDRYGTDGHFRASIDRAVKDDAKWKALGPDKQALALEWMDRYANTTTKDLEPGEVGSYDQVIDDKREQVLNDLWDKEFSDPNSDFYKQGDEAGKMKQMSAYLKGYFADAAHKAFVKTA